MQVEDRTVLACVRRLVVTGEQHSAPILVEAKAAAVVRRRPRRPVEKRREARVDPAVGGKCDRVGVAREVDRRGNKEEAGRPPSTPGPIEASGWRLPDDK